MMLPDVIKLTQKLIGFNTVNPPGDEAAVAEYVGNLLMANGFEVVYIPYGERRKHLIAHKGCNPDNESVLLSGHFDTVPFGNRKWINNPLSGEISDGKLFGRGSSDMKGGLAAMIVAAIEAFEEGTPSGGVQLLFTAGEETGCQGASQLMSVYDKFFPVKGIIVGEPTSNIPAIGHKGGLYLNLSAKGRTAHSSMPHLGDNAIYKIAEAIMKVKKFNINEKEDPLLGMPTINVGKMIGGDNLNSVPDYAEFTIDARTTTRVSHPKLLHQLRELLGNEITVEVLVDLPAVSSSEDSLFIRDIYRACRVNPDDDIFPHTLPYLTDGAVLQRALDNAPTVILGPGEPEMAHKTDEYCMVDNLYEAVNIYKRVISGSD